MANAVETEADALVKVPVAVDSEPLDTVRVDCAADSAVLAEITAPALTVLVEARVKVNSCVESAVEDDARIVKLEASEASVAVNVAFKVATTVEIDAAASVAVLSVVTLAATVDLVVDRSVAESA